MSEIVYADFFNAGSFSILFKVVQNAGTLYRENSVIRGRIIDSLVVVFQFFYEKLWNQNITLAFGCFRRRNNVFRAYSL